jgi:hypothetical protein
MFGGSWGAGSSSRFSRLSLIPSSERGQFLALSAAIDENAVAKNRKSRGKHSN